MRYTIDRFEGEFAVVEIEDGGFLNILKSELPEGAQEGDLVDDSSGTIDETATERKKEKMKSRLDRLFKK